MNPYNCALSQEAAERVQSELRGGEVLHWVGKPGKIDAPVLALSYLVVLIWMVFPLLIAYVIHTETPVGWGIWLLTVPISLLSIVWHQRQCRKSRNTVYMVTNHRVAWIILHRQDVLSLALTARVIRGTVMRSGGYGDIIFTHDSDGLAEDIFHNIPNVRKVAALINDLAAGR